MDYTTIRKSREEKQPLSKMELNIMGIMGCISER